MKLDQLIEDYKRRLEAMRELIKENQGKMAQGRLQAKAGCYRTFISELEKVKQEQN